MTAARTVLVTGSSGLVGSEAVTYFDARGWRVHGASRTVRRGSSLSTVPIPVSSAQERARRAWTSRRAAAPVIHCDCPLASAMRPSIVAAALMRIQGRPRDMRAR